MTMTANTATATAIRTMRERVRPDPSGTETASSATVAHHGADAEELHRATRETLAPARSRKKGNAPVDDGRGLNLRAVSPVGVEPTLGRV